MSALHRAEIEADIAGPIRLRASLGALAAIDAQLSEGSALKWLDVEDSCKAGDVLTILYEGARAAGEKISRDELAERIEHVGVIKAAAVCAGFIVAGMDGGDAVKKKAMKETLAATG